MKKFLKRIGYFLGFVFVLCGIYLGNLFLMKPFSIDHYLAKEMLLSFIDSPEYLTYLGVIDDLNFLTRHQSKLSIEGLDDISKNLDEDKEVRKMLLSYDNSSLSKDQVITKKIALFDLENKIEQSQDFPYHSYPLNQIGGMHLNAVEFMTDIHPIRNVSEAYAYIDRLNLFNDTFDATLEILKAQKNADIFPPRFVFEHVIRQLNDFLNYKDLDNPLYSVFVKKVDKLGLKKSVNDELKNNLKKALNESVRPGFTSLLNFMESSLPMANPHDGVWSLPNGDDFYALRLKVYTTTDYSAQEIHDIGKGEVKRITSRMQNILNQLGYKDFKSVGYMMNTLNEDPKFLYDDTENRKEIVVADYNSIVEETWVAVKDYFHSLPESKLVVKAVPEYSEQNQAGGYYMSPALDGSRPGVFYANLYDIKQTPTYSMRTLAFHEGIPGHHLQIAHNLENNNLSLFRKFGYRTSALSEGWALYSERLALEIGLANDPYDELGVLQSELFRAVRLVVDTGMHYKRWTREEAMDYMKSITGMSDTEVVTEIERYIVWPGQACSYKVGMLKILELRELAKKDLGERFDIKDFHSLVLDHGSPPLFIVEELMQESLR
ncbi:MAG: DUF885 domain-containing protein [SAR86 cluster bacterium]|nr:DUF885 domain-containing protein [SAR86 cluster bacterium]